jgi:hypothetical protein
MEILPARRTIEHVTDRTPRDAVHCEYTSRTLRASVASRKNQDVNRVIITRPGF